MSQFTGEAPKIRHWCDHGDGLRMYGWFVHDGINAGIQEIYDDYYKVATDFVKRPGGLHGGDWSARFRVDPQVGRHRYCWYIVEHIDSYICSVITFSITKKPVCCAFVPPV